MSKAIEKICQACEKSFLARRDAKTCSPTCRKRLERSAKRSRVEANVEQVKHEAQHLKEDVQEGLQRIVAGLLPEQMAYAGAEGLDMDSTLVDEVAADSGVASFPEASGPRSIAVTGENSEAQLIAPTVLKSEAALPTQEAVPLVSSAEDEATGKSPVVVSTMPKPRKKPGSEPHHAFHSLRWAVLALLLLLLGGGVIISLICGGNNHNKLRQLNNAQQQQARQELNRQTIINNRVSVLEVKVNALDARVSNLKVSNGAASTATTNNSSANQALGSDVTLSGNTFNGPNQLVQLTSSGLLPAVDGSNLTAVNAITLQGNPASYYTNASNLSSGTLSDGRLSNNVALLNAANTFSQPNTFSSTVMLGMLGATGGSAICLNGSNQLSACGAGPGTSTLQQTYQASTSPQIVLNAGDGGLIIQDAASAIGGNLFAVQSHGGSTTYFAVTASGITTSGTVAGNGSGLTNLNGANLTAGTVANGALANSSLTVTAGTGLSGGGSVALGASTSLSVAYGATAGTAVQGNTSLTCASGSGNLSGGGNSVTLGSGGSCNNLTITNSPTFSGTLAVQGAGGITVGSTSNTGVVTFLDGTNDGFNASLGLSGALGASQAFVLPASGGTLCTTTTCAAGSGSGYVQLQGSTPGTAQTGNLNITGTGIVGALNVTNAATVGSGLTVTTGGLGVTGNSTIAGTLGSLTGLSSSGTITFSGVGSGVLQAASGVLSTGAVALGTQTTGSYVANLGTLTGLTTSGNSGAGSTPTLNVTYGSAANTAVQGNVNLNCPTISGTNLTGGGGAITLGSGGSCSSIGFTNSPTFSGTLAVQGSNALTLGSTGSATGAILFNGATAASGTLTVIGPANPSTNTLTLPNETGTLCSTGSVCTGYAPSSGSGNYIRNGTTTQTANLNIQSSAAGSVGAIIQGAASQSADILDVENSGATKLLAVSATTTTLQAVTDTPTLGTENITTQPDATWSGTPTNWTTSAGAATHATGNTTALSTSQFTPVNGTQYQVSYTFSGTPSVGTVVVTMGGVTVASYNFAGGVSQEQNFTDTRIATATSGAVLTFTPSSTFIGTISAVSVKTVAGTPSTLVVNNAGANPNIQLTASSSTTNSFIGLSSGSFNTTGTNNTGIGTSALQGNTTGHDNTGSGFNALHLNTVGFDNTAFGSNALAANTIAPANTAVGFNALLNNTTGAFGTAVGNAALQANTTGQLNTAFGSSALTANTTGGSSTAVGQNALKSSTGSNNTALGTAAGFTTNSANATTTGAGNTFLGTNSGPGQAAYQVSSSSALGFDSAVNQSSAIILGCTNGVNGCAATSTVGIGSQYAPNALTVSPGTYGTNGTAGTASTIAQTTTAITGTSTTFTSSMTGGTIYYNDGTTATVTFVDTTHLTSSVSKTVTAGATYTIVYGGLNVNPAGTTYLQPTSDSTSAFQVQNAANTTTVFNVDTTNGRVGVGAAAATAVLTVGTNTTANTGGIEFGTDVNLYRSGTGTLRTDGGFVAGSGGTVLNVATGGVTNVGIGQAATSGMRLIVKTSATTDIGLVLKAVASQSADLLEVQDSGANVLFGISKTGHVITGGGTLPAATPLTDDGSTGTCTVAGNDTAGAVTITPAGVIPGTAGTVCQVNFTTSFGSAPRPVIAPTNAAASAVQAYVSASAVGSFTISFNTVATAQAYTFNWFSPQ